MDYKVFCDEKNPEQQMKFYINDVGRLFVQVGDATNDDYSGFITLDKEDVKSLILALKTIEKTME